MARREVASYWDGSPLGEIELASVISFQRAGVALTVFSDGPVPGLPAGVTRRDAQEILPAKRISRYARNGSAALHANLFRYALLQKTDFIWTDLDVVALRPFDFDRAHVFARQGGGGLVNNAILGLPRDSAALRFMGSFHQDSRGVPPHVTGARRLKYKLRSALVGGLGIEKWPWGSLGPNGLTHALHQSGEINLALPEETFYAVGLDDFARFADPGALRHEDLPQSVVALHLWNNRLRAYLSDRYEGKAPRGSYLAEVLHG